MLAPPPPELSGPNHGVDASELVVKQEEEADANVFAPLNAHPHHKWYYLIRGASLSIPIYQSKSEIFPMSLHSLRNAIPSGWHIPPRRRQCCIGRITQ